MNKDKRFNMIMNVIKKIVYARNFVRKEIVS